MSLESRANTLLSNRGLDFYDGLYSCRSTYSAKHTPVDLRSSVKTIKSMFENLDMTNDGSDLEQITKGFHLADYFCRLSYTLQTEHKTIDRSVKLWHRNEKKLVQLMKRIQSYELVYELFLEKGREFAESSLFESMKVEQLAMKMATKELDERDACVDFDVFLQQMKKL